jgi:HEAT repeat protein
MIETRALFGSVLLVVLTTGCDPYSVEQAKRERDKQKAIAAFEKQQADEQPSNWDEPRLLSALASTDPSDRANAARELGLRKSTNARQHLRELMISDRNSIVIAESELALIRIGYPEDIAMIHDYASSRVETLSAEFLRNLSPLGRSLGR